MITTQILQSLTWAEFKSYIISSEAKIQIFDLRDIYWLASIEGIYNIGCSIAKTTPANSDQLDFETNFKDTASGLLKARYVIVGDTDDTKIGNNGDELKTADIINNSGLNTALNLTTTPIELKVGESRLVNRKYIWIEANNTNVLWGFSAETCIFNAFKNKLMCFPIGNVPIFIKMSTGTGSVSIGEGS